MEGLPGGPTFKQKGGDKAQRFIRKATAAQAGGVKEIAVGFFATSRYPPVYTGTGPRAGKARKPQPVTNVAAWQQFGTRTGIPARPFMTNAIKAADDVLLPILKSRVSPNAMAVDKRVAGLLGAAMKGLIQKEITKLSTPPQSPVTIKLKGSSNPLIDTGFMRMSVDYTVDGK